MSPAIGLPNTSSTLTLQLSYPQVPSSAIAALNLMCRFQIASLSIPSVTSLLDPATSQPLSLPEYNASRAPFFDPVFAASPVWFGAPSAVLLDAGTQRLTCTTPAVPDGVTLRVSLWSDGVRLPFPVTYPGSGAADQQWLWSSVNLSDVRWRNSSARALECAACFTLIPDCVQVDFLRPFERFSAHYGLVILFPLPVSSSPGLRASMVR